MFHLPRKIFYLPSWIMLKLVWIFFSSNHEWKAPRKNKNYKCYTLSEWINFVEHALLPGERKFTQIIINGFFWLTVCYALLLIFLIKVS